MSEAANVLDIFSFLIKDMSIFLSCYNKGTSKNYQYYVFVSISLSLCLFSYFPILSLGTNRLVYHTFLYCGGMKPETSLMFQRKESVWITAIACQFWTWSAPCRLLPIPNTDSTLRKNCSNFRNYTKYPPATQRTLSFRWEKRRRWWPSTTSWGKLLKPAELNVDKEIRTVPSTSPAIRQIKRGFIMIYRYRHTAQACLPSWPSAPGGPPWYPSTNHHPSQWDRPFFHFKVCR